MISQPTEDPTTEAIIEVSGKEMKGISGFSVSQDIMQLGDPFSIAVPNPRGKWNDIAKVHASVKLKMSNPNVNGGRPALMHTGLIVGRSRSVEITTGTTMQLQCADLGWHLMTHCPQPHEYLETQTFERLLAWATSEPSWGFKGVTADTETSRLIELGIANLGGRQAAEALASDNLIIYLAQTEPGQTLGDTIIMYAKRFNRLVNVSPDGYIQIFAPNYTQKASYRIDLHETDSPDREKNNVLEAQIDEDGSGIYSRVTCVGQIVGYSLYDPNGRNPGKFLGVADSQGVDRPPFRHENSFSDGEVYEPGWAKYAAGWRMRRALYDSWTATYRVRGHWQAYNGSARWWVPDTICEINDECNGIKGLYYVAAVKLERTARGDTTLVTIKRKDLFSANFRGVSLDIRDIA